MSDSYNLSAEVVDEYESDDEEDEEDEVSAPESTQLFLSSAPENTQHFFFNTLLL